MFVQEQSSSYANKQPLKLIFLSAFFRGGCPVVLQEKFREYLEVSEYFLQKSIERGSTDAHAVRLSPPLSGHRTFGNVLPGFGCYVVSEVGCRSVAFCRSRFVPKVTAVPS